MITKQIQRVKKRINTIRVAGQIVPSSKHLVKKICNKIDYTKDLNIIQLGFGNGVITKELLKQLTPKSTFFVFEIRTECRPYYEQLQDKRIVYIEDSAEFIDKYAKTKRFDVIVSALPLAQFSKQLTQDILEQIYTHLKPKGQFIQYQYSLASKKEIKQTFNKPIRLDFELLNIPPTFIYEVEK